MRWLPAVLLGASLLGIANPSVRHSVEQHLTELTSGGQHMFTSPATPAELEPAQSPWRTCHVDVLWNPHGTPTTFEKDLRWAVGQIDQHSPTQFRVGGPTDMPPSEDTANRQDGTVVVGMVADSDTTAGMSGTVAAWIPVGTDDATLSGTIVLDAPSYLNMPHAGAGSQRSVLLHELVHAAGLSHSTNTSSLMHPTNPSADRLTPDVVAALPAHTCGDVASAQ